MIYRVDVIFKAKRSVVVCLLNKKSNERLTEILIKI